MKHQKELMHELFKRDAFCLIILDACRYDYFEKVNWYKGNLQQAYSSGTYTKLWFKNTFTEDTYSDIVYVSSNPHIYEIQRGPGGNIPLADKEIKIFKRIVPAWHGFFDGGVHPVKVLELYNMIDSPKTILHFMQPHSPFLGEIKVEEELMSASYNHIPELSPEEKEERRKLKKSKWEPAYQANLEYVLREIRPIIKPGVIITADHGTLIGENGFFGHFFVNQLENPILRNVPWFEVTE